MLGKCPPSNFKTKGKLNTFVALNNGSVGTWMWRGSGSVKLMQFQGVSLVFFMLREKRVSDLQVDVPTSCGDAALSFLGSPFFFVSTSLPARRNVHNQPCME